jgi:acetyl esterase/lipase
MLQTTQPTGEPAALSASPDPLYPKPRTLFQRIGWFLRLHLIKFLFSTILGLMNLLADKSVKPTSIKTYSPRPSLKHRVFFPKSYKTGDGPLPLYLDIHGGGFALANPSVDDKFCSKFANDNRYLVISVDYLKSPAHKNKEIVQVLVDVVKAILDDKSFPFDSGKVAVGGFSAGANLSIAISQDKDLQSRIGGVISCYAPVDFTTPIAKQLASRPKDAPPDTLLPQVAMFNWGYIKHDQNLRDPQLSVRYTPRNKLPPKIYVIGCELDMLCRDAELMAEEFASVGTGERTGTDICWEKNGIKWEKIVGHVHGILNISRTFTGFDADYNTQHLTPCLPLIRRRMLKPESEDKKCIQAWQGGCKKRFMSDRHCQISISEFRKHGRQACWLLSMQGLGSGHRLIFSHTTQRF